MKYVVLSLAFLSIISMACSSQKKISNQQEEGWISLFDGKDMNAWRVYNETGIRGWEIRSNEMVALGKNPSADIITNETFENFDLTLEWAISKSGNSGIFFNVLERKDLSAVYYSGPEYQLLDDESSPSAQSFHKSGSNYEMQSASKVTLKKQGEFNTARIKVMNGKVEHWLNGTKVVEYQLKSPEWEQQRLAGKWKNFPLYGQSLTGHIALQDHGNEVRFRNVRVKRL